MGQRPYELAYKRRYTHHRYEECVKLMETKGIAELKNILLSTDDNPEDVQAEKNVTELISKLDHYADRWVRVVASREHRMKSL